MGNCLKQPEKIARSIYLNPRSDVDTSDQTDIKLLPTNFIRTSKYTYWEFLPKALILELIKISNIYFLIMTILGIMPQYSITGGYTAIIPFAFIILVSLIKQLYESIVCWRSDFRENNKLALVLSPDGTEVEKAFSKLTVGELVVLDTDDYIPADCVLIASYPPEVCYIETASLDGEKGLKRKVAPVSSASGFQYTGESWKMLPGTSLKVNADKPEKNLFVFNGNMQRLDPGTQPEQLALRHFLYKGATIRLTQSALVMVMYTGVETKIQLNMSKARQKTSFLEDRVNILVLFLAGVQILLTFVAMIVRGSGIPRSFEQQALKDYDSNVGNTFLLYLLLLGNMVPISLFVSLEVGRATQAYFMTINDELKTKVHVKKKERVLSRQGTKKNIKKTEEIIPCRVNSFSICDELGRIEFVLSDKTGTLTMNKLELIGIFAGTQLFGGKFVDGKYVRNQRSQENEDSGMDSLNRYLRGLNRVSSASIEPRMSQPSLPEPIHENSINNSEINNSAENHSRSSLHRSATMKANFGFWDRDMLRLLFGGRDLSMPQSIESRRALIEMAAAMLLAHDCFCTRKVDGFKFNGSSPDEVAILKGLQNVGITFAGEVGTMRKVSIMQQSFEFEKLASFEFDSERACQSTLYRPDPKFVDLLSSTSSGQALDPEDTFILFMKGSDSKISSISTPRSRDLLVRFDEVSLRLAQEGYRTLYFAIRYLSKAEVDAIQAIHADIVLGKPDAPPLKKFLAQKVERDVDVVGFSVLEDRLQKKVKDSITMIRKAGVKVWMVTGDKYETALSVGKSAGLLLPGDNLLEVKAHEAAQGNIQQILDTGAVYVNNNQPFTIVIDCKKFGLGLLKTSRELLLLLLEAKTVICCRSAPKDKALLVQQIKDNNRCVLAIGDGENDVNMITTANVGVGVFGKEGTQAVQFADFAIGEFKVLWKLMLLIGRLNYMRISSGVLIYLFKNFLLMVPQFIFGCFCLFSGQSIFEGWFLSFYNTIFTTFPLFYIAVLDTDIHYRHYGRDSLKNSVVGLQPPGAPPIVADPDNPNLFCNKIIKYNYWAFYHESQMNHYFSNRKIIIVIFYSFIISAIFIVIFFVGFDEPNFYANIMGLGELQMTLAIWLIIVVNISFLIRPHSFDYLNLIVIFVTSILPLIGWMLIIDNSLNLLYKTLQNCFGNPHFYYMLIFLLVLYLILELLYHMGILEVTDPFYLKFENILTSPDYKTLLEHMDYEVNAEREKLSDKKKKKLDQPPPIYKRIFVKKNAPA